MSTVSSATATTAATAPVKRSSSITEGVMGKEDFLTLLVAQLQNQDPLNPSDPTEFTAQLAQFSSLEQLFTINGSLSDLVEAQDKNSAVSALEMIGQSAAVAGNKFTFGGETVQLGFELTSSAKKVDLYVMDQNGTTIKALEENSLGAGNHFVQWDGRNDQGTDAGAGTYRLVAVADYGNGKKTAAQPLIISEVKGIDFNGDNPRIVTDLGSFNLNEVKSVRSL